MRESDLRRHLLNETKASDPALEEDTKPDPRFAMTSEQLKAKGITDFQLSTRSRRFPTGQARQRAVQSQRQRR